MLRFRTRRQLLEHFDRHAAEFASIPVDETEYENRAREFMEKELVDPVQECIRRRDRAKIRWDRLTNELGIVSADGFLQTYHVLDWRYHSLSTNRAYFKKECEK
jgi:DNA-binding GntR family transcriptional regulator